LFAEPVTWISVGAGETLIGKDALSTTRSPFSPIAVGLGTSGALSNAPNETVWIPAVWWRPRRRRCCPDP
jgi:hypothetical protein